jgi:hypothetical protein
MLEHISNGARTIIVEDGQRLRRDLVVQETGHRNAADSPNAFVDDTPTRNEFVHR